MKITVNCELFCKVSSDVDLPIKSWKEVKEWYVKWDTLHYTLDGSLWHEAELNSFLDDAVDWKLPISTEIVDEESQALLSTTY